MTLSATVLIPTHNHGRLLGYAARSALSQTIADIELLIVGDGVDDATREVARELVQQDPRVQFFDFPKGPRRGEILRHHVLQQAKGKMVCYLCDDDLWLPFHLEAMRGWLEDADFAHSFPTYIRIDGSVGAHVGKLGQPGIRRRLRGGWNFMPLSSGGHTLDLYRRLPHGWRTSPDDFPTDLYMWLQVLDVAGCRAVSGELPTFLHFPSDERIEWSLDQREDELRPWDARLHDPELPMELCSRALDAVTSSHVELELRLLRELEATLEPAAMHGLNALEKVARLGKRLASAEARLATSDDARCQMERSITWRLRGLLDRLPLLSSPFRMLATAVSSRRAR